MKQRVAIRAIIRKKDQTLLLRRANGRDSILGRFELPGGKVSYNEQPEDSLRRYLQKDVGLTPESVQLFDVITYVDPDNKEIQYVFIIFLVSVGQGRVELSDNYDKAVWQSKSKIQHRDVTESTQILLGLVANITSGGLESGLETEQPHEIIKSSKDVDAVLYMDGGSRGNPGSSAAAYVVESTQGEVIERGGKYLGITTSYQAEYRGLLLALERALELGYSRIECRLDNLMVVNQMKGIYTVKNRELWPINERVIDIIAQFDAVHFRHVRREFNVLADQEVNRILDEHANSK